MSKPILFFAIGAAASSVASYLLLSMAATSNIDSLDGRLSDASAPRFADDPRGSETLATIPAAPLTVSAGMVTLATRAVQAPAATLRDAVTSADSGRRWNAVMLVGKVWAWTDPQAALAESSILSPELQADYRASVSEEWANLDPAAFLAYAEGTANPGELIAGLELLIVSNPERVLEIASRLPIGANPGRIRAPAIRALAESNPVRALQVLESLSRGPGYDSMLSAVLSRYAQQGPDAALAWLDSRDAPPGMAARAGVIAGIALIDFERAYELAADTSSRDTLPVDQAFAEAIVQSAERASQIANVLLQYRESRANQILERMVGTWARYDPEGVVDWMTENAARIDTSLVRAVGLSLATIDPEGGLSLLARLPGTMQGAWIVEIAGPYAQQNPSGALDWVESYRGQAFYEDARSQIVVELAGSHPALVAAGISNLTPSLQSVVAPRIATGWAEQDPKAAADWVLGLQGSPAESEATSGVVSRWVRTDPDAATQWVTNLPRGQVRDNALSVLIANSYGITLDLRPILDEIDSDNTRRGATLMTADKLFYTQPEIAREFYETFVDDPDPVYRDRARDSLERLRIAR